MAWIDKRRTDQRTEFRPSPYWLTSAEINKTDDDDTTVLFSFPGAGRNYRVKSAILEVIEAFDGTPVLLIGDGTIPTDTSLESTTLSNVDADQWFNTTSAAPGSTGIKVPANSEDCIALCNAIGGAEIVGADSTVPVIYATLTASSTITTGKARLHLLVQEVPLVGV